MPQVIDSLLRNHPDREELIEEANGCRFFGLPVSELSREDLLLMVGYLSKERKREQRWQDRKDSMNRDIRSALDNLEEEG